MSHRCSRSSHNSDRSPTSFDKNLRLELDVKEILRMGRVVLLTGLFQFPVCFGAHYLVFVAVESMGGIQFGQGSYAAMYLQTLAKRCFEKRWVLLKIG